MCVYTHICGRKMVWLVLINFSSLIGTFLERLLDLKLPIAYYLKGQVRDTITTYTAEKGWSAVQQAITVWCVREYHTIIATFSQNWDRIYCIGKGCWRTALWLISSLNPLHRIECSYRLHCPGQKPACTQSVIWCLLKEDFCGFYWALSQTNREVL